MQIPLGFSLRTFFSMKHDTFLILKLLIKFHKELVVGQGLFLAKSPCLGSKPAVENVLSFPFSHADFW